MSAFSLSSAFVTFFALVGPPKVLLSFAQVSRRLTPAQLRRLVLLSSAVSFAIAVTMAYSAEYVTDFFHVNDESLELAGGVIFFSYAVALVLGFHLGAGEESEEHLPDPVKDGLRELMLPYVASPLALTAVMVESLTRDTLKWHSTIAGAYLAVVLINAACVLALAPLLRRTSHTVLEVMSRLLGLLLAAVGVELFLQGLQGLGVPVASLH